MADGHCATGRHCSTSLFDFVGDCPGLHCLRCGECGRAKPVPPDAGEQPPDWAALATLGAPPGDGAEAAAPNPTHAYCIGYIEGLAEECRCGGRFRFDAPLRCEACRPDQIAYAVEQTVRLG